LKTNYSKRDGLIFFVCVSFDSDTQCEHFDVISVSPKLAQNLLFTLKVGSIFQKFPKNGTLSLNCRKRDGLIFLCLHLMVSDNQCKHFDVMSVYSKLAQNILFTLKVALKFQEST